MKGLRFQKRVKILPPFIYLNISKTGWSWTFDFILFRLNVGKRGVFFSTGLPGTGISYRKQIKKQKKT
ncbi:DUF4236 domain-containing protein [Photobacterium leiognathi]|uniref:DUF4236 domain-containing protein n=1 Tax=Photobacterium leiognathi TaxID=553611 RepID=UPI002980E89E|nr:DUF4236 domain-containing protein [Photobacterium leiognathi]